MKVKNLIVCLILIMTVFTNVSPVFAEPGTSKRFECSADKNSFNVTVSDMGGGMLTGTQFPYQVENMMITVNTSGVYKISNNVDTPFVIGLPEKIGNSGGYTDRYTLSVLPVATYANDEEVTLDLAKYNNASNRTASVFLEAGKEYYICFVGNKGTGIRNSGGLDGASSFTVNVDYIDKPNADDQIYETDFSSLDFTAKNIERPGAWWDISNTISYDKIAFNNSVGVISSDEIDDMLSKNSEAEEQEYANALENLATIFVVNGLCDPIRNLICEVLNYNVTIDALLFNEYPNTRLTIFSSSRTEENKNELLESTGILDTIDPATGETISYGVLSKYFTLFRGFAIILYLVMLLIVGIKTLLSSTGQKRDKYKTLTVSWVKGIVILFFFPYVMKYSIIINDAIVGYSAQELKNQLPAFDPNDEFAEKVLNMSGATAEELVAMGVHNNNTNSNDDLMLEMRTKAIQTGKLKYALLYVFLIKLLLGFILMYFKRLLTIIFLIVIFPLVTISYALDKGDGKAQFFNSWFKEFFLNVFLQTFQAVNYLIVMSIIFALSTNGKINIILAIIAIDFVSRGEQLLRGLFSKMSGGNAGTVSNSVSEAIKTSVAVSMVTDVGKNITNVKKRVSNATEAIGAVRDKYHQWEFDKHAQKEDERIQSENHWRESYFNPEKIAIDNVGGNIATILSATASREDQMRALDRLIIARRDPNRNADFRAAYASLSASEMRDVHSLMQVRTAQMELLSDTKLDGRTLTDIERNINVKIVAEAVHTAATSKASIAAGGPAGDARFNRFHDYLEGTEVLDDNGNSTGVMLIDHLNRMQRGRVLNRAKSDQLFATQRFIGGVSGVDDSRYGVRKVSVAAHSDYEAVDESTLSARIAYFMPSYGATANPESRFNQQRAARLVAKLEAYRDEISSGTRVACPITEAYKLSKEWDDLATSSDPAVVNILNQLNAGGAVHLNFNREQFSVATSLGVLKDTEHLEGTDAEVKAMQIEAIRNVRRVNNNSSADDVARAMIRRAEIDDVLYTNKYDSNFGSNSRFVYVDDGTSQERKRDTRHSQEYLDAIRRSVETQRTSPGESLADLVISVPEAAGAVSSATIGNVAEVAAGTTAVALNTGMSGKTKLTTSAAAYDVGTNLEHSMERLTPGTTYANADKTKGAGAVAQAARDKLADMFGRTTDEIETEISERKRNEASIQGKIDTINSRLRP